MTLFDLLAPQLLAGVNFPEAVDRVLQVLDIESLHTADDGEATVYTGILALGAGKDPEAGRGMSLPWGDARWREPRIRFRLTLPRGGSAKVQDALAAIDSQDALGHAIAGLRQLLDRLGEPEGDAPGAASGPSDYPATRYRLELLLDEMDVALDSTTWAPARIEEGRVVRDLAGGDVVYARLPKIVLMLEQDDDITQPPQLTLQSWGNSGFAAPSNLQGGELVRLDPPLMIHHNERWAVGFDQAFLDLDPDHTPPEILAFFGMDPRFTGFYFRHVRVHYNNRDTGWAFNFEVRDALIGLDGTLSLEAEAEVLGPDVGMRVELRFQNGPQRVDYLRGRDVGPDFRNVDITNGEAEVPHTGELHVQILGGVPPYTVSVKRGGDEIWDPASRRALLWEGDEPPSLPGHQGNPMPLVVEVTDHEALSSFREEVTLSLTTPDTGREGLEGQGLPADRPDTRAPQPAEMTIIEGELPPGFEVRFTGNRFGTLEELYIAGGTSEDLSVAADDDVSLQVQGRRLLVEVPPGSDESPVDLLLTVSANVEAEETFRLFFKRGQPHFVREGSDAVDGDPDDAWEARRLWYVQGVGNFSDPPFSSSRAPGDGAVASAEAGRDALAAWSARISEQPDKVTINGYASYERPDNEGGDDWLSEQRREVARAIVLGARQDLAGVIEGQGKGHHDARNVGGEAREADPNDRVATITAPVIAAVETQQVQIRLTRAALPVEDDPVVLPEPPPAPPPPPNRPPAVIRRLGLVLRLERNVPVMGELFGQLDIETALERRLRHVTEGATDADSLGFVYDEAAGVDAETGLVDFSMALIYDTATRELTETLTLGAGADDGTGLVHRDSDGGERLINALGGVLVFLPVTAEAVGAVAQDAGDWAPLAVSLGVPAAIGSLNVLRTRRMAMHGGRLILRQLLPPGGGVNFTQAGITFDYSVRFDLRLPAIGLATTEPLSVRYRAVGFNLHFGDDGNAFEPIFDTQAGYEIDLGDPGLFTLPSPLDEVIAVAGVRLGKVNPTVLDIDLAIKADLGVVTVDRFRVRWPIHPLGRPSIVPSGVRVNVPKTLVGSGFVDLSGDGFAGALDVTLVPTKLRVAAQLAVRPVQDEESGRRVVAVFASLEVDFPSPILLGNSGLGLFGLSGLFAMHYRRLEPLTSPGLAVPPALAWLKDAGGKPTSLKNDDDKKLWGPEIDRWSFGVGALLGTVDGGFLANLRGMLMLELPGPRILVFTKAQVVSSLPGMEEEGLTTGMLGVLDLNFDAGEAALGLIIDLPEEVEEFIKVQLPVELFFNLDDPRDWYLHVGTFDVPVQAKVLGIYRARGYFMFAGAGIANFPFGDGKIDLEGISVATGIAASVVLGSRSAGLYLEGSLSADLAASLSPFLVLGQVRVNGTLHLWVVSIEANGRLTLEGPAPTLIRGDICGEVDLRFFSISGCVEIRIGRGTRRIAPPPLVENVYLQSYAPVLTSGQGGERPIDASLGDAQRTGSASAGVELPVVPIDVIPVIQFSAAPRIASDFSSATLETPGTAPTLDNDGWKRLGETRRVRYRMTGITLTPGLPGSPGEAAPVAWRSDLGEGSQGAKTNIDLALLTRTPVTAPRALERSDDLGRQVARRWQRVCQMVAPPVPVLWTFCGKPLGPSAQGWTLGGMAWPDPDNSRRNTQAPRDLPVSAPSGRDRHALDGLGDLLGPARVRPARVLGPLTPSMQEGQEVGLKECVPLMLVQGGMRNPAATALFSVGVRDKSERLLPALYFRGLGHAVGLDCAARAELHLASPAPVVVLQAVAPERGAHAFAYDADGALLARAELTSDQRTGVVAIELAGRDITAVVIETWGVEVVLVSVCFPPRPSANSSAPRQEIPTLDIRRPEKRLSRRVVSMADALLGAERRRRLGGMPIPQRPVWPGQIPTRRPPPAPSAPVTPWCMRALQLSQRVLTTTGPGPSWGVKPQELLREIQGREDWVTFQLDGIEAARLFLAVDPMLLELGWVRLRQRDADGKLLRDDSLQTLPTTPVSGRFDGLPASWRDSGGPWWSEVASVADFLAGQRFADMVRLIVQVPAEREAAELTVYVPDSARPTPGQGVIVGALEALTAAEVRRHDLETRQRQDDQDALEEFLTLEERPLLLEPDTEYALRIDYEAELHDDEVDVETEAPATVVYQFRTDAHPPRRLSAYVLATDPGDEAPAHFPDDPFIIVFNDVHALRMYRRYGRTLTAVVRGADGSVAARYDLVQGRLIDAEVSSPYREALWQFVEDGGLTCIHRHALDVHEIFEVPVELQRDLDYTVEIEADPPVPPPERDDDDAEETPPEAPLFRRTFSTSRFRDMGELAAVIRRQGVRHAVLEAPLSLALPAGAAASGFEITDREMEDVLRAAGDDPRPAAEGVAITLFWAPVNNLYQPHALLLDAPEPLWRRREAPVRVPVDGQDDESFQRLEARTELALGVEAAAGAVEAIAHGPGGTRTLVLLGPGMAGQTLHLVLHRLPSELLKVDERTETVLDVALSAQPPWEIDPEGGVA